MDLLELAARGPVIPVIVIDRPQDAVPLAQALLDGDTWVMEVTLRTPGALRSIEAIVRELPEAVVGAGTLRSAADVRAAKEAGCRFGVSPGYTREIAQACREVGLPLLPGVASASEVMAASADGYAFLKFFPAVPAGGVAMLRALAGPFPDVAFCPTGGIGPENAAEFLALPNVKLVGGSWLTPKDAIDRGDWARIRGLAREAQSLRPAA